MKEISLSKSSKRNSSPRVINLTRKIKREKVLKNKYKKYSIEQKLFFIELMKSMSIHRISKRYGMDRKSLREWRSNKKILLKQLDKNKYRIKGNGMKPSLSDNEENKVIDFINNCKKKKIQLTISKLAEYAQDTFSLFRNKKDKTVYNWATRFLQRHQLTLQPDEDEETDSDCALTESNHQKLIDEFHINLNDKLDELRIFDQSQRNLIISNEILSICLELPYKQNVNSKGNLKKTISFVLILTCTASGEKLAPMIIFDDKGKVKYSAKSKPDKSSNIYCTNLDIFKSSFMKDWIECVYYKYEENMKQKCLLISSRKNFAEDNIKSYFEELNVEHVFVPNALCSVLLPIDSEINAIIEKEISKKISDFLENKNSEEKIDITNEDIIDWILDIWHNDSLISQEKMVKCFDKIGLLLK